MSLESRQYWKQCENFNKNLQLENKEKLDNASEYKRRIVWNTHRGLQEKIEKRFNRLRINQCHLRTQSIYKNKRKEDIYEFLNNLMKTNPTNKEQRLNLVRAMRDLNEMMELGLEIKIPLSEDEQSMLNK